MTHAKNLGRREWIAGADYQEAEPSVLWLYKVFRHRASGRHIWVAFDRFVGFEHAGHLADAVKQKHRPGSMIVIDDASGEYRILHGRASTNSSARLMQDAGFDLRHHSKNPLVRDRVNALLALMAPVAGEPRWRYVPSVAKRICDTMERIRWKGNKLDKEQHVDHDFDALTYPLEFFDPAAPRALTYLRL